EQCSPHPPFGHLLPQAGEGSGAALMLSSGTFSRRREKGVVPPSSTLRAILRRREKGRVSQTGNTICSLAHRLIAQASLHRPDSPPEFSRNDLPRIARARSRA